MCFNLISMYIRFSLLLNKVQFFYTIFLEINFNSRFSKNIDHLYLLFLFIGDHGKTVTENFN